MLSKSEKREFKELASSEALREDMRRLSKNRHNPFMKDGKVDCDKFLHFLDEYNSFMNHSMRPFAKIKDKDMRL